MEIDSYLFQLHVTNCGLKNTPFCAMSTLTSLVALIWWTPSPCGTSQSVTVAFRNFLGLVHNSRAATDAKGLKYGREAAFVGYLASALDWNVEWIPSVDGNWGSRLENGSFDGMIGMLQRKVR